jgi:hypothetical protein
MTVPLVDAVASFVPSAVNAKPRKDDSCAGINLKESIKATELDEKEAISNTPLDKKHTTVFLIP